MSGHHYRLPMKRNEHGEIRGPMDKTNGHSGGIRLSDLNEQMIRVFEAEPTITRCAFCAGWKHMGTAVEGRRAAAEHRTSAHPEIVITPRRRGKKTPPRQVR